MFLLHAAALAASGPGLPAQYFGSSLRALVDRPCIFFNGDQREFFALSALLACGTIGLAFAGSAGGKRFGGEHKFLRLLGHPLLFAVLAALTLALCRWPTITLWNWMGMDESVLLSGANTLRYDPVFWRTVQSTTSGPLVYYPLMIPALFGMPLDYSAGRLMCLFMEMIDLLICYRICRLLMDDFYSRLAIQPIWAFWTIATSADFVQYTSEAVPILILTFATYLAARWIKNPGKKTGPLVFAGFVLGSLPFAKFQALPAGACIALGLAIAVIQSRLPTPRKISQLVFFIAAGMLPTLLVVALTAINHVSEEFWITYVKYNLSFTASNQHGFMNSLKEAAWGMVSVPQFKYLIISLAAVTIVATLLASGREVVLNLRSKIRNNLPMVVLFVLTPIAMFWAIMARGAAGTMWYFFHYYLFLVVPLTLISMLYIAWLFSALTHKRWAKAARLILVCIPTAALIWQIASPSAFLADANYYRQDNREAAAHIILRLTEPSDSLVVWGWRPELYVTTQLRQGCSFGTVERELGTNGATNTQFYRDQFMRDVRAHEPKVIADTTGVNDATFHEREKYDHEVFAEFARYVDANYKYLGQSPEGFRIYLRNGVAPPAAGQ